MLHPAEDDDVLHRDGGSTGTASSSISLADQFDRKLSLMCSALDAVQDKCHTLAARVVSAEKDSSSNADR